MNDHDSHPDDAALRAVMRQHAATPPIDDVDWVGLHARITTAAAERFRRLQPTPWWQLVAGWSARGIPITAAAAAALAIVLGTGIVDRGNAAVTTGTPLLTLEEELATGSAMLLAAGDDADDVINALLFYGVEE